MALGIFITVLVIGAVLFGVLLGRYYAPDDRALRRSARHAKAYMRALNHVLVRDTAQAIDELREVVSDNVDDPDPYFALGAMFRARGEWERAIRVHQSLALREAASRAARLRAAYELGMDYRAAGMPRRATKAMEACLELDPRHEGALRTLAGLYEEQGRFADASSVWGRLRMVRDESPRSRDHHLAVAAAQEAIADGDLSAAAARLRGAEALPPITAHFWVATAELALAQGEGENAIEPLCAALALSPDLAGVLAPMLEDAVGAELALRAAQPADAPADDDGEQADGAVRVAGETDAADVARARVVEHLDALAEQLGLEATADGTGRPAVAASGGAGAAAERNNDDSTDDQRVVLGLAAAEIEASRDPAAGAARLASLVARYPHLLTVRILGARAALANAPAPSEATAADALVAQCRALIAPGGPLEWAARGAWRCEGCGHLGEKLFWRCERCRRWGTVQLDVAFLERAPRPLPRERRAELRGKRPRGLGGLPGPSLDGALSAEERRARRATASSVFGRVGRLVSESWGKARGVRHDKAAKEETR